MADDKTLHGDAAATVRARRANAPKKTSPQAVLATTDGDSTEKNTPLEVTGYPASPAHTLTGSWVAGHITSADYVPAKADGYYAWYPDGCLQPSCRKVWNAGQMVLRSVYAAHGGDQAPRTPQDAHPANAPGGGVGVPSVPGVFVQA